MQRIELSDPMEVSTQDNRAVVQAQTADGPIEIAFNLEFLVALMQNLVACEADLKSPTPGEPLGAVFFYESFEVKVSPRQSGEAMLVLRMKPNRKMGFLLSPAQLEELGAHCSLAAKSPLLSVSPRHN